MDTTIRVGSANAGSTIRQAIDIDYRLESPSDVFNQVNRSLALLEEMVHHAGEAECDILAFPEDMLGLSRWEAAHWETLDNVLSQAVQQMLERLGRAAARYNMYLICCNDTCESGGVVRNVAFFLGRDGQEIGRYYKVNLPVQEQLKKPGDRFPVFETPDLGGVGMLICYDMVFPETARCLALGGADIIFNPTAGGAAFGGPEISRAAFRTRAVENFVYVVVSWGGWGSDSGSMIISPRGEIITEEKRGGEVAIADINPFSGRQCADWSNQQNDMRARLFRERRPEVYGILSHPCPPALNKLPDMTPGPSAEIARIYHRAITVGHGHYRAAEEKLRNGNIEAAIAAFEALIIEYPGTWFDRTARERLADLRKTKEGL